MLTQYQDLSPLPKSLFSDQKRSAVSRIVRAESTDARMIILTQRPFILILFPTPSLSASEPGPEGSQSGGSEFWRNPQFVIKVRDAEAELLIELTQKTSRHYNLIGFHVFQVPTSRPTLRQSRWQAPYTGGQGGHGPRNLRSRFAHKGDPYDFGEILRLGGLAPPVVENWALAPSRR